MAYRGDSTIACPRCRAELHGVDVFRCTCGVWVSVVAAAIALHDNERAARPGISWWRVREPCPICENQMVLCGDEPGLFQGCDLHGYWIDADTVEHTGLSRGIDHDAIDKLREDSSAVEAIELEARRMMGERTDRRLGTSHFNRMADDARRQQRREQAVREANERELERVQRQRDQLVAALKLAIGENAAKLLLARIDELDAEHAQLANRVTVLERRLNDP